MFAVNGTIQMVQRRREGNPRPAPDFLNGKTAETVRAFHRSFPRYRETPLVPLPALAAALGLSGLYVKDESRRFGLNAFKALGGSYAMGRCLAKRLRADIETLPYDKLISEEVRRQTGALTFVTATDGNHGRGVAWAARQLRQKSVVYMPKGSSPERLANIRGEGGDATITGLRYDDAVRHAAAMAARRGWLLLQDTAWEGYTEVPSWIMQGYTTMGVEAAGQLPEPPTHVFLQAGVGSFAGAITGLFAEYYRRERPIIVIAEADKADCLYQTARTDDGHLCFVTGEMDTIMAGLACGEPCTLAWEILRDHADAFLSCPDSVAVRGMRLLGKPLPGDTRVVSGESGAVTVGLVAELLQNPAYAGYRDALRLNGDSRVLCFSTEGDTDRASYRKIVEEERWDGCAAAAP
jgi:diaminopropionate ammonia-lyase